MRNIFWLVSLILLTSCSTSSLLVGGQFNTYDAMSSKGITRILEAHAKKQPNFQPNNGPVGASNSLGDIITIESNEDESRYLIGGVFGIYNSQYSPGIIAIDPYGAPDLSFDVGDGFNWTVQIIKRSPWDPTKYYVGGGFTSYDGNPAPGIIRLNEDGSIDTTFAPGLGVVYNQPGEWNLNARVVTIDFHFGLKTICIGGVFDEYDGKEFNNIVCLDTAGRVKNDAFNIHSAEAQISEFSTNGLTSNYMSEVKVIKIHEATNKIYVQGVFNEYNDLLVNNFCRLEMNGDLDISYPYLSQFTRNDFIFGEPISIIIGGLKFDDKNMLH